MSAIVVWTPEGCAIENELVAVLAKQRSVWLASRDDFALKILVTLRFRLSSCFNFIISVCVCACVLRTNNMKSTLLNF